MLRGELRRREPGEDARILQEAALWYEAQDCPSEAIAARARRLETPSSPPA